MKSENIFGKRLYAARTKREYSQEELATRTGLQPSAISHFETGTRKPSFENLKLLADALEVTSDYLLGRSDDPSGNSKEGDTVYRDYASLSGDQREIAREFMASLAKRNKDRKGP